MGEHGGVWGPVALTMPRPADGACLGGCAPAAAARNSPGQAMESYKGTASRLVLVDKIRQAAAEKCGGQEAFMKE